jgi:kinetochore protein NDC80
LAGRCPTRATSRWRSASSSHTYLHLPPNDATFEADLIEDLGELGCPYKVTCAALRAPVTPHSWPTLLSVLHWLTLFVSSSSSSPPAEACSAPGGTSFLLYTTQAYYSFLLGDDAAVEALDKEYYYQMAGKASDATVRALEKEAQELETEVNKLTSGPSRRQALELEKEALIAKAQKYEAVVETWETKVNERVQALGDLEKVLEAKVSDAKVTAAENRDLLGQVGAQRLSPSM